jgi:cell division protein FtsW
MTAMADVSNGAAPLLLPIQRRDRPLTESAILALIVLALMSVGILMVYSASRRAYAEYDTWNFSKHMMFIPVALGALWLGSRMPYQWLNRRWVALGGLGLVLVMLAALPFLGSNSGTVARRWFNIPLGPMSVSFQPSEVAKVAMIVFLAWFFSQTRGDPSHTASRWPAVAWMKRRLESDPRSFWRGFVPAVAAIGLVCVLILKEDFGTGALVGAVAMILCVIAGWRWWFPLLLIVPGIAGFYKFAWMVPHKRERIEVWLDPWQYFDGSGWHVCQSLMGIGSGGLTGVGFGAGTQKLYIPENTSDFIYAVICEEMGLLGGLLVIGLFAVFAWRASKIVKKAPDRFGFLLASGIMLTVALQAIFNIGVVTGVFPAKGISLPFISYGGSGLVMMSFAVGLMMSVARRRESMDRHAAAQPIVYAPLSPHAETGKPTEPATHA